MMVVEEGMSNGTLATVMIVGFLLIAGAAFSGYSEGKAREKKQEEQGCAYYAKHTITEVPVACYDFFERNNHWEGVSDVSK